MAANIKLDPYLKGCRIEPAREQALDEPIFEWVDDGTPLQYPCAMIPGGGKSSISTSFLEVHLQIELLLRFQRVI
jgi:hypothetical protein